MNPERAVLAASLALVGLAAAGLAALRPGTRISAWVDACDPCPDLGTEHDD